VAQKHSVFHAKALLESCDVRRSTLFIDIAVDF
jgi:hypothetical protein